MHNNQQWAKVPRCIVKSKVLKNPFWWFSGSFWFLRSTCSIGFPQKIFKLNKSPIFANTPCKPICPHNAPNMHTVETKQQTKNATHTHAMQNATPPTWTTKPWNPSAALTKSRKTLANPFRFWASYANTFIDLSTFCPCTLVWFWVRRVCFAGVCAPSYCLHPLCLLYCFWFFNKLWHL